MTLLAVGTVAFDCVETPAGKRDDILGGSASFLSTSAAYFTNVATSAVVGEDFPKEHLDFFASRNIDTTDLCRAPGKTFRWRGNYLTDINVAETLATELNVLEAFDPKLSNTSCDADILVLGNIDPVLQLKVVDQVRSPRLIAGDTMNFWIEGKRDELDHIIKRVDLLSVNDAEARMLSGEDNLVAAAKVIRAMGPRVVVIKRGEHGALVFNEQDGIFAAPAYPLEKVVDPTGAGDSFAGGMMGYLARTDAPLDPDRLAEAVVMGSTMASFAVADFSLDRFRSLESAEIQQRFRDFSRLTGFNAAAADFLG